MKDIDVKQYLYDSLLTYFGPARKRYEELKANPGMVKKILETGAQKSRDVAVTTMNEVRASVGLTNSYSSFTY